MPLYEITGPNGEVYQIEGPEGASRNDVINAITSRLEDSAPPSNRQSDLLNLNVESQPLPEDPEDPEESVYDLTEPKKGITGVEGIDAVLDIPLNILTPSIHNFILKSGSEVIPGLNSSLKPPTLFQIFLVTTCGAK